MPEPGNSQALNRFSYVLGNPLRYTDPTGHYGKDVHYHLTFSLTFYAVFNEARERGYSPRVAATIAMNIAASVAAANQGVDEVQPEHPDYAARAGSPHWWNHGEAQQAVMGAGGDPAAFGRALHGAQDYYSHEYQGYPGEPICVAGQCSEYTRGHAFEADGTPQRHTWIAKYLTAPEERGGEGLVFGSAEFNERFREVSRSKWPILGGGELDPRDCPDYWDPFDPHDPADALAFRDTWTYIRAFAPQALDWWERQQRNTTTRR